MNVSRRLLASIGVSLTLIVAGCTSAQPRTDTWRLRRGRVVDKTGKPIADAVITLSPGGEVRSGELAKTDADGRYELLLPLTVKMGGVGEAVDVSEWKELHVLVPQNDPIRLPIADLPDVVAEPH